MLTSLRAPKFNWSAVVGKTLTYFLAITNQNWGVVNGIFMRSNVYETSVVLITATFLVAVLRDHRS